MITMARICMALSMAMLTASRGFGQISGDQRSTELLSAARASLGGEAALAQVVGLSCAGTYTRAVQDRQLSGDLTIDLQLPDKMLRTETMNPMGDVTITSEQGFSGDALIQHSATSGGGAGVMIRLERPNTADARAQLLKTLKADAARLVLAVLLTASPTMPIELSYAGQAAAPDGKAEVIDAKGPNNLAARIFLDQASHRPLMLTYRGIAPRIVLATQRGQAPPPATKPPGPGATNDGTAAVPAPQIVDIAMYLDDYKGVKDVWLPHHISRSIDGQPSEEWTFKRIIVNPTFKTETFQPR